MTAGYLCPRRADRSVRDSEMQDKITGCRWKVSFLLAINLTKTNFYEQFSVSKLQLHSASMILQKQYWRFSGYHAWNIFYQICFTSWVKKTGQRLLLSNCTIPFLPPDLESSFLLIQHHQCWDFCSCSSWGDSLIVVAQATQKPAHPFVWVTALRRWWREMS